MEVEGEGRDRPSGRATPDSRPAPGCPGGWRTAWPFSFEKPIGPGS